ncbi:GPI ethanolamine phosphate transferase 3 [Habropoda laboriosa]|uniref:GPI ethanolamine phosphate transferase 3 n=1 Tax=Habropoda laboriosa TaxID=597456 RepID=A0A0L7QXF1_9HYME|nr:GPI ethanolamine phosphate transferase 3 [Habropoda laboriosa]
MSKLWNYLIFQGWMSYLMAAGLLVFTSGFLLNRVARLDRAECNYCTNSDCNIPQLLQKPELAAATCIERKTRVVLLVVDALKYEFAYWYNDNSSTSSYYHNKLPIIHELLQSQPMNSRLYKFIADPPTTTMQRLKGLTTGSLPTFIDIGSNFASESINEDNIIDQNTAKGIVFMGDDTWTNLFPGKFERQFPSPSFNVWDLDSVDKDVRYRIFFEMKKKDWSLLIAHVLGIDHCGHKHGANHPEMTRKLNDTNTLIKEIIESLEDDTVFFVIGDHGMTKSGDHGGDSSNEVEAAMFVYSMVPLVKYNSPGNTVNQIDLVPTLSSILGTPIPFSNLGSVIIDSLPSSTRNEQSEDDLCRNYFKLLKSTCSEVWVQFDSSLMSKGLLLMFCIPEAQELKNTTLFATGAVSIVLLVILIAKNWDVISMNCYIVEEDNVLSFLLVTVLWLLMFNLRKESSNENSERKTKPFFKSQTKSNLKTIIIVVGLIACISIRLSYYFWRCREEQQQRICSTFVIGKTSSITSDNLERVLLAITLIVLALYITIIRLWLKNCGNLSGFSPSVLVGQYCPVVIGVCMGCYWALQRLPKFVKVKFALSWQVRDILSPSTFLMFISCASVLALSAIERYKNATTISELVEVPTPVLLYWFLIAEYFFYGTGHQPTFPTIHWDAAFVGTGGHFYGSLFPAILIGINTFGSHIILGATLPLLVIVPFTFYLVFPKIAKVKFLEDDMKRGELLLFEQDSAFHAAVFSVAGKYILLHGIRTFGSMLAATIHCRHLMVWKIFAPKLIFEGLGLLVTLSSVLASFYMVFRIDQQMEHLISRVTKGR